MLDASACPAPQPHHRPAPAREDEDAFLVRLEALARADERALRTSDAQRLVDLAVKLARGRGADDLRIGEGLARLRRHDMLLAYNGLGDLALGELGIDGAHGCWLAGIAEKLASRPLLRAAVRSGAVSLRKADAVVDVAHGEHEAYWVARAKADTVRELESAAKDGPVPRDTDWRDVLIRVPPEYREHIQDGLEVASVILGDLDAPKWKRIEALSMEFLGTYPPPPEEELPPSQKAEALAVARAIVAPTWPAPVGQARTSSPQRDLAQASGDKPAFGPVTRPRTLLRALKRLVTGRVPDDERLGRACVLVRRFSAWLVTGAHGFEHFCVEHLGLAPSTIRQRMKLEWNLRRLPPLREALRTGKLTYEQARAVARVATPADVERRIEEAAGKPTLDTKREAEEESDRQMWRAGRLETSLPERVNALFVEAVATARLHAGVPLTAAQALCFMAANFTDTWAEEAIRLYKQAGPVMRRDRGRCQVPGCSHRAEHLHHVLFRSRGGSDDTWNLVAVCTAHHLAGIHHGFIRVSGTAPDGLVWEFPGRDAPDPEAWA